MPTVTSKQPEEHYFYSFRSPTQSKDLKLFIEQLDVETKVFIINKRGVIFPVEGHLIRGLPKTPKVPKAFFENTYPIVRKCLDSSYSISFCARGLGGWKPLKLTFTANDGTKFEFSKFDGKFSELAGVQGLYVLINNSAGSGNYAYVGESNNLKERLTGHAKLKRGDHIYICRLGSDIDDAARVNYQNQLIAARCPYRNTQHATAC